MGRGRGKNRRKSTGNKKHKWLVQNRQGEVKNSIGNGEAKEVMCTNHRHELRGVGGGNAGGGRCRAEGSKGEGKKCNSIMNKIFIKNNKMTS